MAAAGATGAAWLAGTPTPGRRFRAKVLGVPQQSADAVRSEDRRPGPAHITDDPAHPNLVDGKPPTPENIAAILNERLHRPYRYDAEPQANGLSDKDIANLVAYLISLK